MKAVVHTKTGDISTLAEIETDTPTLRPRDLLVKVQGTSINPVDTKVRVRIDPPAGTPGRILGYDAAGVVQAVGSDVKNFKIGDEVFYAGDITRQGSNAELQAVDERIVGPKPKSLSFADAAAFPLTSITAWELLFESLVIPEGKGDNDAIFILGAAGGVGSIMIQLVKKLTKLTVIATASRPETIEWVKKMGADHVVNHRKPLPEQFKEMNLPAPRYVAGLNGTQGHFESILEIVKPRGRIALIDSPTSVDVAKFPTFKTKALSLSWEYMFTRSMFETEDMDYQKELLTRVSGMIDNDTISSIATGNMGKMSLDVIKEAHTQQESGTVIGKNVMEGM